MQRIFILGAGFSKPAGLPLGNELFKYILKKSKQRSYTYKNHLAKDIKEFSKYYSSTRANVKLSEINFEELISYLDIEHFLRLNGSDTWSDNGNQSQMIIKNLIAEQILKLQRKFNPKSNPLYDNFVNRLSANDIIISFNYDTLLEEAFERNGIRYRLYPHRFEEVTSFGGVINSHIEEIILLKMHGSIDWFDITNFERHYKRLLKEKHYMVPYHHIFSNRKNYFPEKIIDDPYSSESPLQQIYKVTRHIDDYYFRQEYLTQTPLILSPSINKLLYISPLKEFWNGLNYSGGFNNGIIIIGFSLPQHDDYITQPLYYLIRNFQHFEEGFMKKTKLKIIDYRITEKSKAELKRRYKFVDKNKTEYYFEGFNPESLKFIFND